MTMNVEQASTQALQLWLRNSQRLIADDEYDPTKEAAEIQLCQSHIRDIRAELESRRAE